MKRKLYWVIGILLVSLLGGLGYLISQPVPILPIKEPNFEAHRNLDEGLRVEEMMEDLKYLEETLYEVHPKVNSHTSEWLHELFESAYEQIQEPMFVKDFHYMVSAILAEFKDAHTSTYSKELGESYMQVDLEWIGDELYVINSRFLKPKDRVIAINGYSVEEIYNKGKKIISAENEYAVRSRFISRFTTQSFIRSCIGDHKMERITVERKGKQIELPVIWGITPYSNMKMQEESAKNWVRFEIDETTSTCIFTLKTCDYNEEYIKTVRNMFEKIKEEGIQNLIIDVRGNGGGNSLVGDEIIHYLPIDRYPYYGVEAKLSKESQKQRGYIRTKGTVNYNPGEKFNKQVKDLLFHGQVYVLVDEDTFSSANWIGVIFQDAGLGTIIGEPTGNNPNSYGDVLQFQLPNSQIRYQISMKKWIRPDQSRNHEDTLVPDIIVEPTLDELVEGKDVVLEQAMSLITNKKEKNEGSK